MIIRRPEDYRAYRISPEDTNRLVLILDPVGQRANFVFAIEIFDIGGRTPVNSHPRAQEMFFILSGQGRAWSGDQQIAFEAGDCLMLQPGTRHELENTGSSRLYCLTFMTPDDDFAALIRNGLPVDIDDADWDVILGRSLGDPSLSP